MWHGEMIDLVCLEDNYYVVPSDKVNIWITRMTTSVEVTYGFSWLRERGVLLRTDVSLSDEELETEICDCYRQHRKEILSDLQWEEVMGQSSSFEKLEESMLTPKDIQTIMSLSRSTVYKLMADKEFPAIRVGNQYRVPRAAFAQWLVAWQGRTIEL